MSESKRKKENVTLAQVAKMAGVSKMTASRVLRKASGYSGKTRDRVMQAVDELGYVPNRLAAAFGSDKASTLIGVCVPRLTSSMFGSVLDSVDHTLSRLGYQTIIGSHEQVPETEEAWLATILSWRPAGVILSGRTHTAAALEMLRDKAIPVVEIWNLNTSPIDLSVGFNHYDCGHEMGRYMVSKGCRNIAFVGAEANTPGMGMVRLEGFRDAVNAGNAQLATVEILIDRPGFYAGYYGTETVLSRMGDLDGIYYQEDNMAVGGLFFCQSRGLTIPDDIAIAGWGGMEVASVLPKRLTTTSVATQALGKTAAEALVARIRGEPVQDILVAPTRLVPGSTV
jgi:LacI family gluconate utilization system Gnt-I transcriptional repressor